MGKGDHELPPGDGVTIENYLRVYDVYRRYIIQESNLINARITWILTVHGFLYATYGFTLQKEMERLINPQFSASIKGAACSVLQQAEAFLITIASVGITISLLGFFAILAAQRAHMAVNELFIAENLKIHDICTYDISKIPYISHTRFSVRTKSGFTLPGIRGGGNEDNVTLANLAPRYIPLALALSWIISILFAIHVCYANRSAFCL